MDLLESIQIRALRDVHLQSSSDYHLRYIFRWYSKTFHTPLHVVPSLPLVDVLIAFFEEKYEDMEDAELMFEIKKLTETPEEKQTRQDSKTKEELEDEEFIRQAAAAEQERVKNLQSKSPEQQADQPPTEELPEIKMTFVDDESFETELDNLGSLNPPPKD